MKKTHLVFVILLALLFAASSAQAVGDIDVVPFDYDFGNVDVGSSVATLATISNVGDTSLTVNTIGFQAGSSTDFAITSVMLLPRTISARGSFEVEITFAPSAAGASSATLEIASNDPDEAVVMVALSGTGVDAGGGTPLEQIDAILDLIEDSVTQGTLVGSGPGKSAKGRLKALINKIKSSRDLIESESFKEARSKLMSAYVRVDGQSRPTDFAKGDAAPELASKLQELIESL